MRKDNKFFSVDSSAFWSPEGLYFLVPETVSVLAIWGKLGKMKPMKQRDMFSDCYGSIWPPANLEDFKNWSHIVPSQTDDLRDVSMRQMFFSWQRLIFTTVFFLRHANAAEYAAKAWSDDGLDDIWSKRKQSTSHQAP